MSFYDPSKINFKDPSERSVDKLFWRDDMENYKTVKWDPEANEAIRYVNTPIPAFEGDYVLRFYAADNLNLQVTRRFESVRLGLHAVELRWYKVAATLGAQGVVLWRSDPILNETYIATVYWQNELWAGPGWTYNTPTGVQTRIPNNAGRENIYDATWNWMRLTVDFEAKRYHRLETLALDIDLSALPLERATGYPAQFSVGLLGRTLATSRPIYFDDVRLYLDVEAT